MRIELGLACMTQERTAVTAGEPDLLHVRVVLTVGFCGVKFALMLRLLFLHATPLGCGPADARGPRSVGLGHVAGFCAANRVVGDMLVEVRLEASTVLI